MACYLLTDCEDSYNRTIVYYTRYNDFVVIARETLVNNNSQYELSDHTVMPKKFIPLLNAITSPSSSAGGGNQLTVSGYIVREEPPVAKELDITKLSQSLKRLFYNADCDAVPFTENQLGYFGYLEEISELWGINYTAESPAPSEQTSFVYDDEATVMETPVSLKRSISTAPTATNLSRALFTDSEYRENDDYATPGNVETPGTNVCLAPAKKAKTKDTA